MHAVAPSTSWYEPSSHSVHCCDPMALVKVPRLQLRVMFWPGLGAGLCWSAGNIFGTLAVEMGGNAVTLGQVNTVQLVASGVWGLLWYKEIRGWHALAFPPVFEGAAGAASASDSAARRFFPAA